ncbi:MAG: hypothetical protein AB7O96_11960 [Pseudobdellovibrionaceae bacterium]
MGTFGIAKKSDIQKFQAKREIIEIASTIAFGVLDPCTFGEGPLEFMRMAFLKELRPGSQNQIDLNIAKAIDIIDACSKK